VYLSTIEIPVGRENEILILANVGAFYLGFPYAWFGGVLYGAVGFLPEEPISVALFQALFWFLGAMSMAMLLYRSVITKRS
jgi:hypothetical protein